METVNHVDEKTLYIFDRLTNIYFLIIYRYVTYCMKFVDMLLSFGIKPILVFDGCNLPSKKEVDKARRE